MAFIRPDNYRGGIMANIIKKVADGEEPIVVVPVVLVPVQVEIALGVVPVEVGDVAVAERALPDRARRNCTKYLL